MMTRGEVLRDSGRTLLLGMSGWAVGAILIARFATGALVPDLDLVYLAVVLWVAVPVMAIAAARLMRNGGLRRNEAARRMPLVGAVIALATCVTLIDTTRPIAQQWSTLQVWIALAFLTPFGVAVGAVPRLARIEGWTGMAHGVSWRTRVGLVGVALATFIATLALGDMLLAGARIVGYACDGSMPTDLCSAIQPTQPVIGAIGWALLGGLTVGAIGALAFDLAALATGLAGMLYLGVVFWLRYPWNGILDGSLTVTAPLALLALHVMAAVAIIATVALIHVFRQPGGSETERELTEWLRAEAFLPARRMAETRPADGKATS
jgi:hypothetical protein